MILSQSSSGLQDTASIQWPVIRPHSVAYVPSSFVWPLRHKQIPNGNYRKENNGEGSKKADH